MTFPAWFMIRTGVLPRSTYMIASRAVPTVCLLAGLLIACGDGGEGGTGEATAAPEGTGAVAIDGNAFDPESMTIAAGDTIEWVNLDSATHTVTADDGSAFASDELSEDDVFRHNFEEPGQYAYSCQIHPFMHGTITVE